MTDLKKLHMLISAEIEKVDVSSLWPGFLPLRFALYTESECCLDGEYIEKTSAFCANTSIEYEGEQIAIWNVMEELEPEVLASKIVHEMFHGFQNKRGWNCFPDEVEALMRYRNDPLLLSAKLCENRLLLELLDRPDDEKLERLLSIRRERLRRFPFETEYEAKTEQLEGSANYVEWKALSRLAPERAAALVEDMRAKLTDPRALLPARIPCYYSGALLIDALLKAGRYDPEAAKTPFTLELLKGAEADGTSLNGLFLPEAAEALESYDAQTERMIKAALERGEKLLDGPLTLVCPNIYNARRWGDYITSSYFLMYAEGDENKIVYGDFVVGMKDERTIDAVWKTVG